MSCFNDLSAVDIWFIIILHFCLCLNGLKMCWVLASVFECCSLICIAIFLSFFHKHRLFQCFNVPMFSLVFLSLAFVSIKPKLDCSVLIWVLLSQRCPLQVSWSSERLPGSPSLFTPQPPAKCLPPNCSSLVLGSQLSVSIFPPSLGFLLFFSFQQP